MAILGGNIEFLLKYRLAKFSVMLYG